MTPQDHLIVVAAVPDDRVADLRAFLATMTLPGLPGACDPANVILPFGRFDTIHFARLLVLEDNTLDDRAVYPDLPKTDPVYLCLMIDCDGEATEPDAEDRAGMSGAEAGVRVLRGFPSRRRPRALDGGASGRVRRFLRQLGRAHCRTGPGRGSP